MESFLSQLFFSSAIRKGQTRDEMDEMEDYSVDSDDVKFRMEEFVWCTFFIVVSSRKSGKKPVLGA